MSNRNNYTTSYIFFTSYLGFFYSDAKKYKNDAIKIKTNYPNDCISTFQLLCSLAFELLPKVLLGYDYVLNIRIRI